MCFVSLADTDCFSPVDLAHSPVLLALTAIVKSCIAEEFDSDDVVESVLDILETYCAVEGTSIVRE